MFLVQAKGHEDHQLFVQRMDQRVQDQDAQRVQRSQRGQGSAAESELLGNWVHRVEAQQVQLLSRELERRAEGGSVDWGGQRG